MIDPLRRSTLVLRTAFLGALLATAGCHYVKQDDLDAELARVRQEMRTGDDRVSGQVAALDAKTEQRMRALETNLRSIAEEFGARIERIEGSLRIETPITYDFDKADLEPSELPVLERMASILKEKYPDALLTVEGFTDPAGSAAYNLKLGMKRAETVRDYLVSSAGMPREQVRAVSYGESPDRLVTKRAQGPGDIGRENRRAVIVIDMPGAAPAQGDRPVTQ
jgi:peptidoglycan-associated lipoprotein